MQHGLSSLENITKLPILKWLFSHWARLCLAPDSQVLAWVFAFFCARYQTLSSFLTGCENIFKMFRLFKSLHVEVIVQERSSNKPGKMCTIIWICKFSVALIKILDEPLHKYDSCCVDPRVRNGFHKVLIELSTLILPYFCCAPGIDLVNSWQFILLLSSVMLLW